MSSATASKSPVAIPKPFSSAIVDAQGLGRAAPEEALAMLSIPPEEMTPAVTLAITALLEHAGDLNRELEIARESLNEATQLMDADCLAPITNRRAFMRRLRWAIAMHARYGHPSTILYLDLNDFKKINDAYGHAAGDAAILHVSKLLTGMMRESDFVSRIGGDEFGIIMYHANKKAALQRAAKIAETLRKLPFVFEGNEIPTEASFGSHELKPGDTEESALAAADKAMYAHKRGKVT